MSKDLRKGAVLITTLWIVTILSALCVSVAHRSAITLKLASYKIDKIKSYFVARTGIYRALALKKQEYDSQRSHTIDALNEDWANEPDVFKEHPFKGGTYTLSYSVYGEEERGFTSKPFILYGLSDEQSRLNINNATAPMLTSLITLCGISSDEAEEIAYSIIDWRDEDSVIGKDLDFERSLGAETEYYEGLERPYPCKNAKFEALEELLLVKGITPELFYGNSEENGDKIEPLKDFITIYTKGSVNINTATVNVLQALFAPEHEELSGKIAAFRRGADGDIGTSDDRWFSIGTAIIEREEGLVEIKNLNDGDWLGNIFGVTSEEYGKIKQLTRSGNVKLTASSKIYRALADADVRGVLTTIEAVYEFESDDAFPVVRYWHQE